MLAIGGDLSPNRLLLAYANGIFPWPEGENSPLLWASPDPRLVFYPNKFHVSRRLHRTLKKEFIITFDSQFEEVIRLCASVPRVNQHGTWITKDIIHAYIQLHHMGFAHSVEVIEQDSLVGGLYGIALGGVFSAESMFHLKTYTSKIALYHLAQRLIQWDFDVLDAQVPSPFLKTLGAEEISRKTYLTLLSKSLQKPTRRGKWAPENGSLEL